MPITFNCPCGKVLRVADENAGRRVKCPACQAVGNVPAAEPQFEVVEDAAEPLVSPPATKARPTAKPAKDDDDEDDGRGYTVADTNRAEEDEEPRPKKKPTFRKSSSRDDDDDDDEQPRKKSKRSSSREPGRPPSNPDAGKKVMYLIGGLAMVAVGIILAYLGWQSTGRSSTRGLIFGICLAFVGLGTAIKGITGNFDDEE